MNIDNLQKQFVKTFGSQPQKTFFAPGRINLIGEHLDYNGGYVLPCAISLGTYGVVAQRNDQQINFYSLNFPNSGIIHASLTNLKYQVKHDWANYLLGMIWILVKQGYQINHGFDLLIAGDLPNGAGLSSSAAMELLMGKILLNLFNLPINNLELAMNGQKVENDYIGVNSGIMDQFAIAMGKQDQAILLNTDTLQYQYVPLQLAEYAIVIMNTNKRRELQTSKYNERRHECEHALHLLQQDVAIHNLCDLNKAQFDEYTYLLNNDTLIRRTRHVVFENQRVLQVQHALMKHDLTTMGHLLNASHISLHYDYAVTGKELDTLVAAAWQRKNVLGARMCGAGFGGCAIAIVKQDSIDNFCQQVGQQYHEVIGYDATFYVAHIANGPQEIK